MTMDIGQLSAGGKRSFSVEIESRARQIVRNRDDPGEIRGGLVVLEQEIALTLEHIERAEELRKKVDGSLLQQECYIDTDLMQMEQRTPAYSRFRFPEREKLQRRLGWLERERRDRATTHVERLNTLRDRLLTLITKHDVLLDY